MNVRDKVIAAAEELFAIQGYETTSVQDIIDLAEVSKGGLYHHFNSKEEILDTLLQSFSKLLRQKFDKVSQDANTIQEVFWQFAKAKELLPINKQDLYRRFLFNPKEIVIREKFLHYIREQMIEPMTQSIRKYTKYDEPESLGYLIISLTEIPTRLPHGKIQQSGFMDNFLSVFNQVIKCLLE